MTGLGIGLLLWALSALTVVLCLLRARELGDAAMRRDLSELDRRDGVGRRTWLPSAEPADLPAPWRDVWSDDPDRTTRRGGSHGMTLR